MYKAYNPNPAYRRTEDCVIRAIAKAFDTNWITVFDMLTEEARNQYDMIEANHVWIGWLVERGYKLYAIPYTCPGCYTVRDFAKDHPIGTYIIGDGKHVVTVIDGDWYDSWNSADMSPTFYMVRSDDNGLR